MSNEVEKKEKNEVMVGGEGLFSNSGFEGTTNESYLIPMMRIVQALSDVKKKSKPDYNPDAVDGQFYNSALNELVDELNVRVIGIDHQIVAWTPRDSGGKFVGSWHKTEEDKLIDRQEGLKKWDKDGNILVETLMFTCMDADNPTNLFYFPLASTSLKYGKSWLSKMKAVKVNATTMELDSKNGKPGVASWAIVWNLKTVSESNDQGEWFVIGKTPTALRTFAKDEVEEITNALEMMKKSKVDYGTSEDHTASPKHQEF